MTIEELKSEADKLGYRLVKKPSTPKKLDCVCGAKSRNVTQWYTFGYNQNTFYRCKICGFTGAPSKDKRKAIELWNIAVKSGTNYEIERLPIKGCKK